MEIKETRKRFLLTYSYNKGLSLLYSYSWHYNKDEVLEEMETLEKKLRNFEVMEIMEVESCSMYEIEQNKEM